MSKTTVRSKQSINMSHIEYMQLHRRMYAVIHGIDCRICLYTSEAKSDVYIDVTKPAFDSFLNYEMDFSVMLSIFGALCIKYGSFPCPF